MTVKAVIEEVGRLSPRYVTVTGGEPLAQKNCLPLLGALCDAGYQVSLETSGALDVSKVDKRVMKVLDIKTPASGEVEKNLWDNLVFMGSHDEIKFVLCDEADYAWAKQIVLEKDLDSKCAILFSPAQGQLSPTDLADWILRDRLNVRMQLQMHKILWGNVAGH